MPIANVIDIAKKICSAYKEGMFTGVITTHRTPTQLYNAEILAIDISRRLFILNSETAKNRNLVNDPSNTRVPVEKIANDVKFLSPERLIVLPKSLTKFLKKL